MSLTFAAIAMAGMVAAVTPNLTASPANPVAGSAVSFTLHSTYIEPLSIDFGDASARHPIVNSVPVSHIYVTPGTYIANVYTLSGHLFIGLTITVAPRPSVQHAQSTSLSWPTGAGSLALLPGSHVPQPVALVRVDAPGTIVLQWLLDGAPVTNATQVASAAGVMTFTLSSALPPTGSHSISARVLSPAPPAFGGPPPAAPITYSVGAPTQHTPVVSHVFYNGPPPVVKILPITLHTTFVEGTIYQDAPLYGKVIQHEFTTDYGLPIIDDNTAFQWHEANPGTADYFEFRIYDGAGKRILGRVTVSAGAYVPDAAFMQRILGMLRQSVAHRAEARASSGSGKRGGRGPAIRYNGIDPSLFQPTLEWQVAGYKHFSQGQSVDLEVEKSVLWPLGMPDKPNGLSAMCPSDPYEEVGTSLNPSNLAAKANGNGGTVVADYPGDAIALGGTVDLSRSPYHAQVTGVHPQPTPTPQGQEYGSFSNPVIQNNFDNVYVDWGDGDVERLHAGATANQDPYVQRPTSRVSANSLRLPLPTEQPVTDHIYDWPGKYNVRVFQLSESDAQGANFVSVADAALPPHNQLAMPALHFASAQSGPNYAAIAGRAYMVYCHQVTIDPVEDTVATGPLHLISVPVTSFPGHDPKQTAMMVLPAQASSCDDSLQAEATLTYYGSGFAKVTWRLDGIPIGSPEIIGRLSSPQRSGLKGNDPSKWAQQQAVIDTTYVIHSPELSTKALGLHHVTVLVTTAPDPTSPNLSSAVANAVGSRLSAQSFSSSSVSSTSVSSTSTSNLRLGVLAAATSPQQFGVVILVPKVVLLAMQAGIPGVSGAGSYNVAAADPTQPCKFAFPTTSGTFDIGGLQGHIHKQGSTYSGSGTLELYINSSATKADLFDVPLQFSGWTSADGANVAAGTLDVSPSSYSVHAPGVAATVRRLQATAKTTPMDLTMDVGFADQTLRIPGGTARPSWNGLSEPVDPTGNWYAGSLTLPTIEIGWTRFEVSSSSMAIDLSHTQGRPGAGACGDTGDKTWVGVDLGDASVAPYTMDLVQNGALKIPVKNWVVDASGLCVANMNATINFTSRLGEGAVNIPSVSVKASNGNFNADYPGMSVNVPWIGATLSGDAKLIETGTQTGAIYFSLSSPPVTKQFGPVRLTASNLQLTEVGGLGWTVSGDGLFHFDTGSAAFTDVPVPNMYFTFAGRPAFAGGATTLDVPLSGGTLMGRTPLDLQSVHLSGATSGNDRLAVAFSTVAHLSAAMPVSNVQVNYDVTDTSGSGPVTSPFTTEVAFPSGNPTIDAKIAPAYDPSSGANTRYYGKVDLAMLGGPPLSAEFLLGYQGTSDYWLTRATIPLSPAGVPLVPGIMNLYAIQGGLGYHMALSSFQDTNSIQNAPVDLGTDLIFMAGMQVGSQDDGFAYTFNGNFTVATGQNAGARMDYRAWLLTPDHDPNHISTIDLQGYFQYAGDNFDGRTWGGFNFMPGVVYASLGNNANNAAVNIHFGGGHWHVYAGQKNGPKITVHVLVADADGYIMIGDDGFSVGAGESIDLEVGDSSVVSAYIRGNMEIDLTITPQPHVIGDFNANASIGACVVGWCGGAGATANVHAEAVPVNVHAHATLSPPWPIPDISVDVHL